MPAYVSLALAWTPAPGLDLAQALRRAGYACAGDETWMLNIGGRELLARCRHYPEAGWSSATIDFDEEAYLEMRESVGRRTLDDALIETGAELVRALKAAYLHFDEEAEADLPPSEFDGETLFGITLVPRDLARLDVVLARPDLIRIEYLDDVVVLRRRPGPLPHEGA